ncbi:DUF5343 domain-containing protein [Dehalococcoides mccartyi]|uniref:DUF5343 domain-containing protein n=1 Tax=Dehalococcoides mccartyi (strain ATCC BAA-2266 / KCTC 15142 / 195) TaxID=243164 RepID=Q3Z8R8_DEHM1|nr:DUF5343 domain-containing protein [Dehalococcoides mccartyi]AAW40026.1 hypothetical protein DET0639 [Dehalococcoides mccartyi 195]
MANLKGSKPLPPYVSYRTFLNFLLGLQEAIPSRLDRSFWGDKWSGSTGTQLMAALRFLGLADNEGMPREKLRRLVDAKGEDRTLILRQIALEGYEFVFNSSADPESLTYAQLEELFHNSFKVADDVVRKCIKFFLGLAEDADIPISPFVTKKSRTARSGAGTKKVSRKIMPRTASHVLIPDNTMKIPENSDMDKVLLGKFPTFDPAWTDEVKVKWFEAFDVLLKKVSKS